MRMRLTISGRLFLLLSVPATLLVILSLWLMLERWQSAQTLDNVGALADRAPIISGLVHEMQKERGYSAGFIGSQGKQFADRLDGQRISTDKALKVYETELASLDLSPYSEHFRTLLSDVDGAIGQLRNKRGEVDRFALSVGQMAGYYTGTINQLIGLVEDIGKQSTIDQLAQTTLAYEAIILAKERAGLERAMGANGFGKGKFEPNILRRFVDLVGQQRAFLKLFAMEANAEQLAFYEATLNGPVIDEVERLRDIATRSPFTGDLQGVTGPQWFDAITRKINLYKTIEDRLADDLVTIAAQKGTEAIAGFWTITIVLSLAVCATILLGWYVSRDIVQAIRGTVDTIGKLARGEDTQVQGVERSDEIGVLSRSLETVYQKGLEAARLRSALEGCSTMIMVANRDFKCIFINGVMKQLFQTNERDFQSHLPAINEQSLIGIDLGKFSPELDALREAVQTAQATQHVDIALGSRRFKVSVSPVLGDAGRFLGTVVEWIDLTSELAIQEDISRVIGAARNGDFSQRIELKDADGIYGNLADGMNQLTGVIDNAADELGLMLEAMAKGDLSRRMSAEFQGKFGELRDNANTMADQLTNIVGQVQNATDEIRNASSEISAGTEDLSNRTEQAASNLEETAAASDQMSATVKQNAENAKNANQLALSANQVASRGADVVEKAVSAMSEIDGSAQRITQIIGVIDEIAFQTNLLALNASVEAARAGESGKGFAVVAQEVRQLAQRSAQAADDIKALIKSSNEQVEGGVKLVNQAGETLAEILGSIGQVTSIVQDISGASQEQASGVLEITSSINNMDEMTQQNSALVEESAASARALDDQAQRLNELMGFFKTDRAVAATSRLARSARSKTKPPALQRPVTETAPAMANDGWADF